MGFLMHRSIGSTGISCTLRLALIKVSAGLSRHCPAMGRTGFYCRLAHSTAKWSFVARWSYFGWIRRTTPTKGVSSETRIHRSCLGRGLSSEVSGSLGGNQDRRQPPGAVRTGTRTAHVQQLALISCFTYLSPNLTRQGEVVIQLI